MKHKPANTLLYDDTCPMCTFQMRVLSWVDWWHVVRLTPLSHAEARALVPHLPHEELIEAIHCVTADGRIYRGARALRFLGMRMPLTIPMGIVLWIPGVIGVAEWVYALVSRNRHLLSRLFGCKGACAIMPVRKRKGDARQPAHTPDTQASRG